MIKKAIVFLFFTFGLLSTNSLVYSQINEVITKLAIQNDSISGMQLKSVDDEVYTFYTKSLTPRIVTKPLEQALPSQNKILTFEYICSEGLDVVNVWFGPNYDKEGKELMRRVAPAKDWKVCSIDLGDNMKDWGKKGDILRIDLGDDADVVIKIRNIQIRPMDKEERQLAEAKDAMKRREAKLSAHLRRYLAETYQSSINKVSVTGDKISIEGESEFENTFLCEVSPYLDVTEEQEFDAVIPITAVNFSVQQDRFVKRQGITYDRLLSKWVLAKKTPTGYQLLSHAHYPDEIKSKYNLPKEVPSGKKGLGGFYVGKGPVSDLDELGISSVTVNIRFGTFMYSKPATNRIQHSYNGKKYYFDQKAVERLDATLQETVKRNIIVAAILLVNKAEQCPDPIIGKLLQHPNMDPAGNYSMPNMTTPESVDCYAAALDFLASRYSLPDKKFGRIHHWIMHNEVNMGTEWTNMGNDVGELPFMDTYIKSMRMCYNIARAYNAHAEVMISVTKQWMWKSKPHFYLVKNLMDILLDYSKAEGDFQWGMANHPYPESLYEPKTWLDKKAQFNLNTPLITFKNLEVLDAWIKLPETLYKGKEKRTLWLSENGTNSRTYSEKDLAEQAAGFAYTWKKVENLSGIDAMQWHNWIDGRREYGLRIGLRRFPDDEKEPSGKKPVWYAYQAASTEKENTVFDQYKNIIGIKSWDEALYRGEITKESALGFNPTATYRMNNNVHYIPKDNRSQQKLVDENIHLGYGGFATNVSYGDYLTPSGMEAFKSFSDKAKAAGMELWLYDEQGYPSGNAGGRVFEKNHDWEAQGLFKQDTLVNGGVIDYKLPPGKVIKAICVNNKDTMDMMAHIENGRLKYNLPKGKWQIVVFSKSTLFKPFQVSLQQKSPKARISDHYPSLMIPEVTETFIDITHDAYADLLGKDLGKYFASTFTDEPSLMAMSFSKEQWSVIPWTQVLSDSIESRYGYRPEDRLMQLFEDAGPAGQQVRYQYFHTVADLFSKNYFKKIKEWCNQHNLKSGGHLLLEETMMAHVPLYGDIFACYREMDAPGIDALSLIPENTPVHTAKLASSAAELTGATRVMSEPCPVIDRRVLKGKEPTTEEVRGFINIQLTGGVTDFNNYLNLSNANDEEKVKFNEYVGRIGQQLRGGYGAAEVALLYPIESLWTAFVPEPMQVVGWDSIGGGNTEAIKIEQAFRNTARYLFKNRWDYHCIDTKAIQDSKVIDGKLVHGNLSWKLVILPQVNTLPLDVCEKLYEFVQDGGFLVIMGNPPVNSTNRFPDKDVQKLSSKMLKNKNVFHFPNGNTNIWNQAFDKSLKKDVRLADESLPIRYTHRVINGKQVYFVINDSAKEQQTNIFLKAQTDYMVMDPLDGEKLAFNNGEEVKLKPYTGIIITEK